jgi:Fic family protein
VFSNRGFTVFQFCPPSQVEEQLKLLLSLLNKYQNEHADPLVLAAWFHAEFIRIHPFVDGNDRVGRLLSSKILMNYDLLPMIVERQKRSEYIECMNESIAHNNLTSLVNVLPSLPQDFLFSCFFCQITGVSSLHTAN